MTPLELVTAPMTARGARPRNPASPNSALSRSPRPKPIKNLRAVRTTPFHIVLPAIFTSMVAPLQNRNRPIRVGTPFLNRPDVKPPMVRALGKKVFIAHPRSRGITITPAGKRFIVANILINLFSFTWAAMLTGHMSRVSLWLFLHTIAMVLTDLKSNCCAKKVFAGKTE